MRLWVFGDAVNALDQWFLSHRHRLASVVFLDEALFGGNFSNYAIYRLRVFGTRVAADFARRFLEFFLIVSLLSPGDATGVLLLRATTMLGTAYWWGALEKLRESVRSLARQKKTYLVPRVIAPWMAGILVIGGFCAVFSLGLFFILWMTSGEMTPTRALVLVIILRFFATIIMRTYHSGIYALRRIYRPIYIVLLVEVLGAVLTLSLRPTLGAWALPLIGSTTAAVSLVISFHYVTKTYRFFQFLPLPIHPSLRSMSALGRRLDNFSAWAGLSYALAQTEWVLVIVLLAISSGAGFPGLQVDFLFLLGPILGAGREWAQLFYFDLKRLDTALFANLGRILLYRIECLALVIAAFCWLATSCLFAWTRPPEHLALIALTAPGFIVYTLYAFQQIRAFSEGQFVELLQAAFATAVVTVLAIISLPSFVWTVVAIVCGMLWGLVILQPGTKDRNSSSSGILSLSSWCNGLPSASSVSINCAHLKSDVSRWQAKRIAAGLTRLLPDRTLATLVGSRAILWSELSSADRPSPEDLLAAGNGAIEQLDFAPEPVAGMDAIASRLETLNPVFKGVSNLTREFSSSSILDHLCHQFRQKFPGGEIFDLRAESDKVTSMTNSRGLLSETIRQIESGETFPDRENGLSLITIADNLTIVFSVPRKSAQSGRTWRAIVRQYTLAANLLSASASDGG